MKQSKADAQLQDQVQWVKTGALLILLICGLIVLSFAESLADLAEYESSPIDWCETNYEVHEYVAEFWNSLSSIPIALVAPLSWAHDLIPVKLWVEFSKVRMIFFLIVLIGLGSTYFHATLSVFGQIMDEMSIIWLVLYAALLVLPKGRNTLLVASAFLKPVFVAFLVSTTLLGLLAPVISHIFVLSCVPFGIYTLSKAYHRSKNESARARFRIALRFFAAAWTCWLIDKFACQQMQLVRELVGFQPQLHAAWHLLVSVVAYICIGVCCEFREENLFSSHSLAKETQGLKDESLDIV